MATVYCPQCGQPNSDEYRFCQECGAALEGRARSDEAKKTAPLRVAEAAPAPPVTAPSPLEPVPPAGAPQRAAPAPGPARPISQMGAAGHNVAGFWGPFAGYGERGEHASWLLDTLGERAEELRAEVTRRFKERQIPKAQVERRVLTGQGIDVERRPYYLVRRGITTEGLYIARFGQDLYISRITYVKGPLSIVRALILGLMIFFQLFMTFGYSALLRALVENVLSSFNLLSGYSGGGGVGLVEFGIGFLACCIGPLGALNALLLVLAALYSFYKFIRDKDPLALLRKPSNEFQFDDTIALEKAVEETVRQSMDAIGIDAKLLTPVQETTRRRRLV